MTFIHYMCVYVHFNAKMESKILCSVCQELLVIVLMSWLLVFILIVTFLHRFNIHMYITTQFDIYIMCVCNICNILVSNVNA